MINQVDKESLVQGITYLDIFSKFDIMLKAIIGSFILIVLFLLSESLILKIVIQTNSKNNDKKWPTITEVLLFIIRVGIAICLIYIFMATIFLYNHRFQGEIYELIYNTGTKIK